MSEDTKTKDTSVKSTMEIILHAGDARVLIMQAMDCFILPSRFEGLPLVGIEAQTSGLWCYFSDVITNEIRITELTNFISLNNSPEIWAKKIIKNKNYKRRDVSKEIIKAGYDIDAEIKKVQNFYERECIQ